MADIFISYAREDKEFVERLCRALKLNNREAWFDLEGILPSAEWRQEIFSAIESAEVFVQVISPRSAASDGCAEELSCAVRDNKRIVPILHQDVIEAELPAAIRDKHWVSLRDCDNFDTGIATLVKALDINIEWVRAHTRLLVRAREWENHNRDYSYALHGTDLRKAEASLSAGDQFEPRLLPLQIDYILASRKAASRKAMFAVGLGSLALVCIVIFGALFFVKRQENVLNLAANFREMGISELENSNPLGAEVFLARALAISDNVGARERLIEARAQSPRLLWVGGSVAEDSATLAISGDGVLFAVSSPLAISIWNSSERRQVRAYRMRASPQKKSIATFGSGHTLLAVATTNNVNVWDLQSASEHPISSFTTQTDVSSLSISSDGSTVIVGEQDGSISSWSMNKHNEVRSLKLMGHSDRITGVAISADDQMLVSGSWDETAGTWDLQTGTRIAKFTGHDDALLCVAISPNGEVVASAGWDDTIWIWDRKTGKGIRALIGHRGSIFSLAFSSDGKWLVSGSEDRTARLWEVERGRHILTFPGHSGAVTAVGFVNSKRANELVTGDATGVIRLWDLSKIGQRKELTTLQGSGAVTRIDFDPAEPLLASSAVDGSINVWDLRTGTLAQSFENQRGNVSAVAFSPDGKYLASATKTSFVRLWDLKKGEARVLDGEQPEERIRHVAFSRDGALLAGGSEDGKITLWDVETGLVDRSFAAHTAKIQGLQFSPDGTLLASSSEDSTIKLWDSHDWHLKTTLIGHQSGVYETAFSPDGKLLLSGSDDNTARLWDVLSGKEVIKAIQHGSPVWAVDFDGDGKTLATGSEDSTIQLWKVSGSGTGVNLRDHFVLHISDGPIWWLKFHDDSEGHSLGIASQDKTVRVLRLSQLETLFSNTYTLESEAEQQGGLIIDQGPAGEPQLRPMQAENFVSK